MISKIFGASLILAGAMFIYFERRRKALNAINQAQAYLTLFLHIRNKVDTYRMPLDKILTCCDEEVLDRCGILNACGDAYTSLSSRIEESELLLDGDTKGIVLDFAGEFGRGYAEEQLKACDDYIVKLRTRITEMREQNKKDAKVYLVLSLCITLSIVLILL